MMGVRPRTLQPAATGSALWLAVAVGLAGCNGLDGPATRPAADGGVPYPVSLLLPESIHIHSFSGRTFARDDGTKGIEGWITPRDAFDDPTKAFGEFRFELYEYHPGRPKDRGPRVAWWSESVMDRDDNRVHWDLSLAYKFMLAWDAPTLPAGQEFILAASFDSPFTHRLFDQRRITVGR